jgi:tetratricopeptide (TPR) repeat protein
MVSLMMDNPDTWAEAISIGRQLVAELPDSVDRLNGLGYALIQRPEGLEEGFRLLWRGYSLGEHDYAVVDSLGWAYYLHGAFDEALALIQRSNEMSRREPNAEILDHLGDVLWRLDRRQEAQEAWRQALRARPEQPRRGLIEGKLRDGLTTPAPVQRPLPEVDTQTTPSERSQT